MRFCVNVSILFNEFPLLDRFDRVKAAGFSVVEFWWPSAESIDEVERAVRNVGPQVALLNFDAGDMAAGGRGLLSDPSRDGRFRENVPVALEVADRLGCKRLNAMVEVQLPTLSREEQLDVARNQCRMGRG